MASRITQRCVTGEAEETRRVGIAIGRQAQAGDIIACYGALGAGKTTFVQGLATGLGVGADAYVRSPTFALVHMYYGRINLYHFDFYRLSSPADVEGIGFDEYVDAQGVVVIEWADKFMSLLPPERLEVFIHIADLGKRVVRWTAPCGTYGRYFLATPL